MKSPSPYGYPLSELSIGKGKECFSTGAQALMELDQAGAFKK